MTYQCRKCKEFKSQTEFYLDKRRRTRPVQSYCKPCSRIYNSGLDRNYTSESLKKKAERKKFLTNSNNTIHNCPGYAKCDVQECDRIKFSKMYCYKHHIRFKKYNDPLAPRKVKYRTPEEKLQQRRNWRKKNMENPYSKLSNRLRVRISNVLRDNMPQNKKSSTRSYFSKNLGCTSSEFIKWISDQWHNHPITGQPMNWDNYGWGVGKWTLDHKRPIKDFKDKGEDIRKANHFSNIQPMWFEENMRKGSKVDF